MSENMEKKEKRKKYKEKYNKYILCPVCGTIFNLSRAKIHMYSVGCLNIQNIKDKGENIDNNDKLFLKINEQKKKIKYESDISGEDTSNIS
jgi:hypothetical protein